MQLGSQYALAGKSVAGTQPVGRLPQLGWASLGECHGQELEKHGWQAIGSLARQVSARR